MTERPVRSRPPAIWLQPLLIASTAVLLVAATGWPEPINGQHLLVAGISMAVGVGLTIFLVVLGNRGVRWHVAGSLIGVGLAVLIASVLRIAIEKNPALGAVIFGGFGGFFLVVFVLTLKGTKAKGQ